jgi:hypothetical protein
MLLLVHTPPVVGESTFVSLIQISEGAVTTGKLYIVTAEVVLLHPVVEIVNLKVVVPAITPVTAPALVTVAIAGLLLIQVPPVVGDNVLVNPLHIDAGEVTIGKGLTTAVKVLLVL